MSFNFFEVLIPGCHGLEEIIRILVVLVGLVSLFLTLTIYDCKLLRLVFVILGTVGLLSLLLFLFAGSLQALGLWGTIGLVVSFHALILPEIAFQLRLLSRCNWKLWGNNSGKKKHRRGPKRGPNKK
jgi:hypothetical protein